MELEKKIIEVDKDLIKENIPLIQRPFKVLEKIFNSNDLLSEYYKNIQKFYFNTLYPDKKHLLYFQNIMLLGGINLRDQFYLVEIKLGFGTFEIIPLNDIVISKQELEILQHFYSEEVKQAIYKIMDLYGLNYALDDHLKVFQEENNPFFEKIFSHIRSFSILLNNGKDIEAAIQDICLTVEFAMKGFLFHKRLTENAIRRYGHNLINILEKVFEYHPELKNSEIKNMLNNFPDYVKSRYNKNEYSQLQINIFAENAQYIASRILCLIHPDRNLEDQLNSDNLPPRSFRF